MRQNDLIVLNGEVAKGNALTLVVLIGCKGSVDVTQNCLPEQPFCDWPGEIGISQLKQREEEVAAVDNNVGDVGFERDNYRCIVDDVDVLLAGIESGAGLVGAGANPWRRLFARYKFQVRTDDPWKRPKSIEVRLQVLKRGPEAAVPHLETMRPDFCDRSCSAVGRNGYPSIKTHERFSHPFDLAPRGGFIRCWLLMNMTEGDMSTSEVT
jgi:hypothetical protein